MYKITSLRNAGTKNCLSSIQFILFFSLFSSPMFSQITWDGGAMTTLWSDAANWDPDGIPVASDDVSIDGMVGTVSVDVPSSFTATAKSVTLTNQAGLFLNNTGILKIDGSTNTYALTLDGSSITNSGSIQITNCTSGIGLQGDGASIANTGSISVNTHSVYGLNFVSGSTNSNVVSNGIMSFDNGSTFPAIFFNSGLSNGNIYINSGALNIGATAHGGIGVALGPLGGYFINMGTMNIIHGSIGLSSGFTPGTFVNSSSGTVNFGAGISGNWIGGFNLNLENEGHININNVNSAVNVVVSGSGIFGGSQPFSTTNKVSPGNSGNPGCLLFNSGYFNSGTTEVKIGGTSQCSTFDVLFGSTSFSSDGILNVTLINGFTPTAGQSFTLVNAASRTGVYTTVNYPTVSGITWTTSYTSNAVIANALAALPVELTHFSGRLNENNLVQLNWQTASETNNRGFSVERMTSDGEWTEIGFVEGNGTTTEVQRYEFLDKKTLPDLNYYRLRQLDFDGKEELSKVVSIDFPGFKNLESLALTPNPTNGIFDLKGDIPADAIINITDSFGRLVKQQKSLDGFSFDLSGYESGIYSVKIILENQIISRRIIKQD